MKRSTMVLISILFLVFVIILPFIIEMFYEWGKTCPIIKTGYTASDALGYIASASGLAISIAALLISLDAGSVRFKIEHACTCNDKNEVCININIVNDSNFDCLVNSVSLANKSNNHSGHIMSSPPFEVKSKSAVDFDVPVERIQQLMTRIRRDDCEAKLCYRINLSTGKRIFLNTKDLEKCMRNIL